MKYKQFSEFAQLIEGKSVKEIEGDIIDFIINLKEKGYSLGSQKAAINSLNHFYSINDVVINRKYLSSYQMTIKCYKIRLCDSIIHHLFIIRYSQADFYLRFSMADPSLRYCKKICKLEKPKDAGALKLNGLETVTVPNIAHNTTSLLT